MNHQEAASTLMLTLFTVMVLATSSGIGMLVYTGWKAAANYAPGQSCEPCTPCTPTSDMSDVGGAL